MYDAFNNELSETHKPPCQRETVFKDLDIGSLSGETLRSLHDAEASFSRLERKAYDVIKDVLERTVWGEDWNARKSAQYKDGKANPVSLHMRDAETLRKYLLFLRFRNSEGYQQIVDSLRTSYQSDPEERVVFSAYRPLIVQLRLRHVLQDFTSFLEHTTIGKRHVRRHTEAPIVDASLNNLHNIMDLYCWRFSEAELCIGVATEDQEFIISDKCFGTLDEGLIENP